MGMSFGHAESILGSRDSKKVANNTFLVRVDKNTIVVRHMQTDVVTINRDGTYILNNGGWQTLTSKDRINTYGPVSVAQKKGNWFVFDKEGNAIPFVNGMKVRFNGEVIK